MGLKFRNWVLTVDLWWIGGGRSLLLVVFENGILVLKSEETFSYYISQYTPSVPIVGFLNIYEAHRNSTQTSVLHHHHHRRRCPCFCQNCSKSLRRQIWKLLEAKILTSGNNNPKRYLFTIISSNIFDTISYSIANFRLGLVNFEFLVGVKSVK